MFHIPTLCERRAKRGMTRVSDTRFAVHFFAGNSIVNSPLCCWVLNGECERLWKPLCARLNTLFTVARRACTITGSNLIQFTENIFLSRARYGVEANVGRLSRAVLWEFVPFTLSRQLDAFRSNARVAVLKNLKKHF
jgi:hypothetical protein